MGRPKSNVTKTPAEKMREYRERQKQQKTASEVALEMVAYLEDKKVTLLKFIKGFTDKGKKVEIRHRGNSDWCEFVVLGGYGSFAFDAAVFKYLVVTGEIEFVENGASWMKETVWCLSPVSDFVSKS